MKKVNLKNFRNLEDFLNRITKIIDPKIKEVLNIYLDKKTKKIVNYQIEVGGKRLRPALAVASCLSCRGKINDVLYPAAGIEILHNYTLIVDDIIDNSNLRRKKPTTWFKFGKSIAECIGMDYSSAIFQAGNKSKNPIRISELFSKTIKAIAEGQILDILFEQAGRKDEKHITTNRYKRIALKDYLKMIRKKTASLIQTSCEIGGLAARAKKSEIAALKNYGLNLGIAFQIKDDILDIFGNKKELGKKICNDIKERKLGNIVIFYALKALPQRKKRMVLNILRKEKIKDKNIKEVIKIIKETKAKEKSYSLGKKYAEKAKASLKPLVKNEWSKVLNEFTDFIMERKK